MIALSLFISLLQPLAISEANSTQPSDRNLTASFVYSASALSLAGGLKFFGDSLYPDSCNWCERRSSDQSAQVNAFDRSARNQLRWKNAGLAQNLSHVVTFGVIPLMISAPVLWPSIRNQDYQTATQDFSLILEAVSTTFLLNQIVGLGVGRETPRSLHQTSTTSKRNFSSFYSDHSSLAFATTVSSAMIATYRKNPWAPYLWAGGLGLSGFATYLRIAADRHHASDALTGAAVGAAVGFLTVRFRW